MGTIKESRLWIRGRRTNGDVRRTKDILAGGQAPILRAFALSNTLLALDYDGTLAPVAPTPALVRMRSRTRRLLVEVARRYPCIVITGRSLQDVTERLAGIPLQAVFGNYGGEPSAGGPPARVRRWARILADVLSRHQGVLVEDKGFSVTVHYRHARSRRRALKDIHEAARKIRGARILEGDQTVTLLPKSAPDKGVALQRALRRLRCESAIYVGDDGTDEDAFASAPPDRLLSIRVGSPRTSAASYRLERQADIDALLRTLRGLRQRNRMVKLTADR